MALGVLALICLLLGLSSWLSRADDDATQIDNVLAEVITACENGELGEVLEHIAADYSDAHGLDRLGLKRMLMGQFLRGRSIFVQRLSLTEIEVEPQPARVATARFRAAVAQGLGVAPAPSRKLALFAVTVQLRRDDGPWRITGHKRVRTRLGR